MRLRPSSTSSTLTRTTSPDLTTSRGSETKLEDMAETCTSPSWCTPTSTNAPNAATLVTCPSSSMPGRRSEILCTPSAKVAVRNTGRGSRPGFSSSARMSVTVGSPNLLVDEVLGPQRPQLRPVADQGGDVVGLGRGQDPVHHRVGLRVHPGDVERIVAAADAQEAGALLERLRAQPGHAGQRGAGAERARSRRGARTICVGQPLGDPGDPAQQRHRRGVDVHPDRVHAVLDHRVQRAGQRRLGQVVLVLADADRLRVDLHQLGQRVLQPAGDGHRAAQRHVQLGQLGRGVGRRRVHRGAGLADHHRGQLERRVASRPARGPACRSPGTRCRCRSRPARRRAPRPASVSVASAASQARRGSCG